MQKFIVVTRSGSNSIHVGNLQKLMIEIFKSMNGLNPHLVWEFHERQYVTYNLGIQNFSKTASFHQSGQRILIQYLLGVLSSGTPLMIA